MKGRYRVLISRRMRAGLQRQYRRCPILPILSGVVKTFEGGPKGRKKGPPFEEDVMGHRFMVTAWKHTYWVTAIFAVDEADRAIEVLDLVVEGAAGGPSSWSKEGAK